MNMSSGEEHVLETSILNFVFRFSETAIKYVSFLVLVIQNAAQVLVMRYVRTRPREMFLSTVAVFFTEIVKVVVCILWIVIQEMSLIRLVKLC